MYYYSSILTSRSTVTASAVRVDDVTHVPPTTTPSSGTNVPPPVIKEITVAVEPQ